MYRVLHRKPTCPGVLFFARYDGRSRNGRLYIVLFALTATLFAFPGGADDTAVRARIVFEQYRDMVVTVRAVVGISYGGSEHESEQEANATLLDADGLAVLALSAIDPMQLMQTYRSEMDDVTSRIVSLRVILSDGTEKPAEVVLRDRHLDLAFIRITETPETPLPHVTFDAIGRPDMFDEVVCIMQYGRVARRAHAGFVERIEMIVERPRLFYAIGDHRSRDMVCSPAFTLDGAFVGVGVMRLTGGGDDMGRDDMIVIIVPAEQIGDLIEQVPPRE